MNRRVSELLAALAMAMAILSSEQSEVGPAANRPVAVAQWGPDIGPLAWFGSARPQVAGTRAGG